MVLCKKIFHAIMYFKKNTPPPPSLYYTKRIILLFCLATFIPSHSTSQSTTNAYSDKHTVTLAAGYSGGTGYGIDDFASFAAHYRYTHDLWHLSLGIQNVYQTTDITAAIGLQSCFSWNWILQPNIAVEGIYHFGFLSSKAIVQDILFSAEASLLLAPTKTKIKFLFGNGFNKTDISALSSYSLIITDYYTVSSESICQTIKNIDLETGVRSFSFFCYNFFPMPQAFLTVDWHIRPYVILSNSFSVLYTNIWGQHNVQIDHFYYTCGVTYVF